MSNFWLTDGIILYFESMIEYTRKFLDLINIIKLQDTNAIYKKAGLIYTKNIFTKIIPHSKELWTIRCLRIHLTKEEKILYNGNSRY